MEEVHIHPTVYSLRLRARLIPPGPSLGPAVVWLFLKLLAISNSVISENTAFLIVDQEKAGGFPCRQRQRSLLDGVFQRRFLMERMMCRRCKVRGSRKR